jgi:hypothetical protein
MEIEQPVSTGRLNSRKLRGFLNVIRRFLNTKDLRY